MAVGPNSHSHEPSTEALRLCFSKESRKSGNRWEEEKTKECKTIFKMKNE
jgi:hypothetical protein